MPEEQSTISYLELENEASPTLEGSVDKAHIKGLAFYIGQELQSVAEVLCNDDGEPMEYDVLRAYLDKWGVDADSLGFDDLSRTYEILCAVESTLHYPNDPRRAVERRLLEVQGLFASKMEKMRVWNSAKERKSIRKAIKCVENFVTSGVVSSALVFALDTLEEWSRLNRPKGIMKLEQLFSVAEEYEAQSAQYKELGWLTTEGDTDGIKDKEGRFYPMPTLEEVYEVLSEQLELLQYKAKQGFKRFILAPIGLSYMDMYTKLGEEYQRHQADGLPLYRTDAEETEYAEEIQDTWFSGTMEKEADCYYYPKTLREGTDPTKHGGKTKQELITSSKFPGWEMHILPEDTNLPREGAQGSKEKGGRVPLPADIPYQDYPDIINGVKTREDKDEDDELYTARDEAGRFVFEGESGLIPEVWLSLAFQQLRKEQRLLNDYYNNKEDSAAVLTGVLTKSGSVPVSSFNAHSFSRRVELDDGNPYDQVSYDGFVSSVKVC